MEQETRRKRKRPNKQPHLGIEKKRKDGTKEKESSKERIGKNEDGKMTETINNEQHHTNQPTHLIVCDANELEVMLSLSV
jgi:hypothetical protein